MSISQLLSLNGVLSGSASNVGVGGIESDIVVSGQTYRVHVFNSSGTFTISDEPLTEVEYLVIAGGGVP